MGIVSVTEMESTIQLLLLSLLIVCASSREGPTPIVLWHGMGDSCCNPISMGSIKNYLEDEISGVYVHSIMIGSNIIVDMESGFFRDTNRQVSEVCEMMANDPQLQDGYNAIGFSQGGQFLRAVAQRCPNPPMKNLVGFGAQHQGVFGFPNCPGEINFFCDIVRDLLNYGAYVDFVQDFLVQAQYWHDPLHFDTYVENLSKLENFVMVKHNQDSMVEPRESSHFEFYVPGQADDPSSERVTTLC